MTFITQTDVTQFYENYAARITEIKESNNRPLTYAQKILFSHGAHIHAKRGASEVAFTVDRVAMQDATAQMALLQFILTGKKKVAVPTTVHCDHLIAAAVGASEDLQNALLQNNEVYQFLQTASNKYGIGFWKPGSGIIHQVVLENYATPGMLMIGTDSHTPNAGGVGTMAIGVGGADAVDAMAGQEWRINMPRLIGVHLKGKLSGWASPKDVILKVAEILTVKGGTGSIIEYFGEGIDSISATGRATITNMGAEVGATTSLFPYDSQTADYLRATQRGFVAEAANSIAKHLRADMEIEQTPELFFDEVIILDLSRLEPHIVGPHTPDLSRSTAAIGLEAREKGWPALTAALIGSCTNSSYEDMSRAASIARQAAIHGIKAKIPFLITPGSEQIHRTIQRDHQLQDLQKVGGMVLANACGPCIGQWNRQDTVKGTKNSIITSYNRNFKKRNDANPDTHAFIASPEIVIAYALAGTLDFNPLTDTLQTENGQDVKLQPPQGECLPSDGFVFDTSGYEEPTGGEIIVLPTSQRIALLEPFPAWDFEQDFKNLAILVKAKGKCTTDHISPAGKWLRFRGHLDNISDNMFSGAVNAFTDEVGKGINVLTKETADFNTVARHYQKHQQDWIAVGDSNYGEGSSREHAAMEPRFLGCRAVVAKSFARIAETNLKKQGVLPLLLQDSLDYDKFLQNDRITIIDPLMQPKQPVSLMVEHDDGSIDYISCRHSLTAHQIEWFKAGSALNWIRNNPTKIK